MSRLPALEQICDYATNANMSIIVYFARNGDANNVYASFLSEASSRWGNRFLGVYFNDEQGGKMIDSGLSLYDNKTGGGIDTSPDGYLSQSTPLSDSSSYSYTIQPWSENSIVISRNQVFPDSSNIANDTTYYPNGTIVLRTMNMAADYKMTTRTIIYEPNGSIHDENGTAVADAGDKSQFSTYEQVYSQRPLQTPKEAADLFVGGVQNILTWVRNISDARLFTSDYALDWFDYQAGYDVVLAQLGWGQNATQNIARIRGAAEMQGKSWGTMITWASTNAPYLMSGSQMFDEMRQSYRSGADYVVVFNFNQSYNIAVNGSYAGNALLKDEQFAAIQRFWTEVVQNPSETNNAKGSVAFALPQYYGCVLRGVDDRAWGIFNATSTTATIYNNARATMLSWAN